jgi:hypothetical protein
VQHFGEGEFLVEAGDKAVGPVKVRHGTLSVLIQVIPKTQQAVEFIGEDEPELLSMVFE